jgi:hypothetical protein
MRKLFLLSLLIIAVFFNLALSNEFGSSALNLTIYNDANITASLDEKEAGYYANEIDFTNLNEGRYFLKVIKETNSTQAFPEVIFNDYVYIPSGSKIFAVIDEKGSFNVYKKTQKDFYSQGWNKHDKCNCDCQYCRNCIYKEVNENWQYDACGYKVMSDNNFSILMQTIGRLTFETSIMETMKQAIDKNTLKTLQVRQLLQKLTFENSKIEIAKYAYAKTCDRENYYSLYDLFGFESSIMDVKNYIDGYK